MPMQPKTATTSRSPVAMNETEMRNHTGIYQNAPDYLKLELVLRDGKLFLKQAGQPGMSEVVKVGNNLFNAGGQEILLIPGADGKTMYMHIAAHVLRKM